MEKPCLLTNMPRPKGIYTCFKPFIEKHFTIIVYEEFLKRKEDFAEKIRAIFLWGVALKVDLELLRALPNLQVVVNGGVGVDHLDIPLINGFGVKVCNTPHVVNNSTADIGMALMLASARKLLEGHNFSKHHESEYMPESSLGTDVSGAILGIIGMGRIGFTVAKRARGFDMRILYYNRNRRSEEEEKAVGAVYCEKLEELLQKSDFVMITVSLSPQTHKLIGAKELAMMKPSSTLINISRGLVVDQDALVDALQKKVIKAAALDVTYPEPLPRDHPLLLFPNVIVLPHMGTHTVETSQVMLEKMVVNALAVLNGEQAPNEFGAELRRFSLDRYEPGVFKDFCQFILNLHHLFSTTIYISYADAQGDLLPINNDYNFRKAVSTAQLLLRIFVQLQEELDRINFSTNCVSRRKKSTLIVRADVSHRGHVQIGVPQNFRPVSSIIDVDILPECHRRVRLYHQGSDRPLGFYIRDGVTFSVTSHGLKKVPGIFISRIVPGGLAESSGLLAINDQILEVNGIEVIGKTLDQVTDMMIANSRNLTITVKPSNQSKSIRNPIISPNPEPQQLDGEDSISYPGLPMIMGAYVWRLNSSVSDDDDSDVVTDNTVNPSYQRSSATIVSSSSRTSIHNHHRKGPPYSHELCRSQPCLNFTAHPVSCISLRREMSSQPRYWSNPAFRQRTPSTFDILGTLSPDLRQRLMIPPGAMEEDGNFITL